MSRRLATLALLLVALALAAEARPPDPVLVVQNGHNRPAARVRFSPDGAFLASGGGGVKVWDVHTGRIVLDLDGGLGDFGPGRLAVTRDRAVDVVDAETGRVLHTLEGHASPVRLALFSPEGRWLLSAGEFWTNPERSAFLWDARTFAQVAVLGDQPQDVHAAAFHPDGSLVATAAGRAVRLWEVPSGRRRAELKGVEGDVEALAFSPDGRVLATAGWDGRVQLYDARTGDALRTLEGHGDPVRAVAFSPDSKVLASAGRDDTARLWNPANGTALAVLEGHGEFVESLSFTRDGHWLATGSPDGTARLWSVPSGRPGPVLEPGAGGILAVDCTRDLVATGTDSGAVAWWSVPSGTMVHSLEGRAAEVQSALFDPGGQRLAVAARDRTLRLWNLVEGRLVSSVQGLVAAMAFNQDGTLLAATLDDGSTHVWNTATGDEVATIPASAESVRALAFRPDGRLVLASGGGTAEVREPVGGHLVKEVKGDWRWVLDMNLSPDGSLLATAEGDRFLTVWSMEDGSRLGGIPESGYPASDPRFSPDGKWLAAGTEGGVVLWNVAAGKLTALAHPGQVSALAFDSGSARLATGTRDGRVAVWDLASGVEQAHAEAHRGDVWTVGFGPSGRVLASAGTDGLIRFLQVPSLRTLATALAADQGDDWLATTPEGFFDGSPAGWRRVAWRLSSVRDMAEPEQFFRDFFHPGLLAEVLAEARPLPDLLRERGDPRAAQDLGSTDRRLPAVRLEPLPPTAKGPVDVALALAEAPPDREHPSGSGVQDVRLLRNGLLVQRWLGPQATGRVVARGVPLLPGENRFTAYAFNRDGVKSQDAPEVVVTGDASLRRPARAFVLAIGIDRYADADFDLQFAAADARAMAASLQASLAPLNQEVLARTLLDGEATRDGILQALRRIRDEAGPEDTVVVSYSGHGVLVQGDFYIVPHDLRPSAPGKFYGVSDADLEALFADVQAQRICLILDACQSGSALDSAEWRQGPMNARGLAQLAYEKGMEIVTASQSQGAALEAWSVDGQPLGHGLLTYALVKEGLPRAPRRSGRLFVDDWLDFAATGVPRLMGADDNQARAFLVRGDGARVAKVQVPRVFHRRYDARPWAVAEGP